MFLRERLAASSILDDFGIETPVFSTYALKEEPIKWLKYLLLDKFGLESITKIQNQIFRFPFSRIQDAQNCATTMLEFEPAQMVVVKVVPWDSGAQLKNYRIYNPRDIEKSFDQIRTDFPIVGHEVWCCVSPVNSNGFNLGGRVTFPLGPRPQILELVWFSSPRKLEQVTLPEFEYPYVQSIGNRYVFQFEISRLYLPKKLRDVISMNTLLEDYHELIRFLEDKRENMEALSQFLFRFGAHEVSFCFKVANGRLTIIDWDSEIESTERN